MDTTLNQFQYVYENLSLYQFQVQTDWYILLGIIIFGIILMVSVYYAVFFSAIKIRAYQEKQVFLNKKKTLTDLILMKDIQTELEKEIEQAILKAAFHS
ncbi:hypothetical protein K2X92_04205 [Candidatus Gracilibacteria bacterium]|nr:hypothetical protein [Candidatus Gracilibacteria bacterium]